MRKPLWEKGEEIEDWVIRFTVGNDYVWDQLLLPYDVKATLAHVHGLGRLGLLEPSEIEDVEAALGSLMQAYSAGSVTVSQEDEDCHTVIENYLTEQLGDTGKKIHLGRSRNDQVLAALRLYLRDALRDVAESGGTLCGALIGLGESKDDWVMPGYTHTRQAMPSSVGAWALGFAELLLSDIEGLLFAQQRINVSPLGSAAGYGVPFLEMPRESVASELEFESIQEHVTSVQLSRGKLELEVVHALLQLSLTLNRLASDLILFSSTEYGFVSIAPRHTTGSSIMPQKRNPDVLELIRASYHRVLAESQLLASLPAGLSSGYHRDLQLTKEAVMRAVAITGDCTGAMATTLGNIHFDRTRMKRAIRSDIMATHEAIKMTLSGKPFRDAYQSVAHRNTLEMTPEQSLEAFVIPGYPGHGRPGELRQRLEFCLSRGDDSKPARGG